MIITPLRNRRPHRTILSICLPLPPTDMTVPNKMMYILVLPLVIARNVTVPVGTAEGDWSPYRMVIDCAGGPMFMCMALGV